MLAGDTQTTEMGKVAGQARDTQLSLVIVDNNQVRAQSLLFIQHRAKNKGFSVFQKHVRSLHVFKNKNNRQVLWKPNQDICESSLTYGLLRCPAPRRADRTALGLWPGLPDFYSPRW